MSVNDSYDERLRGIREPKELRDKRLKELRERLRNKPVINNDFGTIACTEDGEYILGREPEDYHKENK